MAAVIGAVNTVRREGRPADRREQRTVRASCAAYVSMAGSIQKASEQSCWAQAAPARAIVTELALAGVSDLLYPESLGRAR